MDQKPKSMQTITGNDLEEQLISARREGLSSFGDIEHRLELVRDLNGVEWVNDSKATDVDSTGYSIEYMKKPVVWLIGEAEEDQDYALLSEVVANQVRAIVLFGKQDAALNPLIATVSEFKRVDTVEQAVEAAASLALEGEIVLFSPACSSFNHWENYKVRGQVFRDAVNKL